MYSALSAVIIFGIIVVVHELGHFLLAKLNGVGVIEFSVGFGKKLLAYKSKTDGTTYSIRLIPLGGFVRMAGDDPRLMRGEPVQERGEGKEEPLSTTFPRHRWFLTQSYWRKFSIVLAGPAFNLIFAIVVGIAGAFVYGIGQPVDAPIVGQVISGFPAETSGLKAKDRIVQIDGKEMKTWMDLVSTVGSSGGKKMDLLVERKDSPNLHLFVTGVADHPEVKLMEGEEAAKYFKIGILPDVIRQPVTFSQALKQGTYQVWMITKLTLRGVGGMITGAISTKSISGPVFIFKEAASSAQQGFDQVINFLVFLSVSLAILNLLPIPVLDGGHLVFFTIEALKGSPVNLRAYEWATNVGMMILFGLMALAFSNDIMRLMH